ncbi:MAG: NAD(P)/FAD-dependent oxidoreductase, partial [Solirubrobacterales bacterium]
DTAAAEHVVMVGGSYIGCEVAASLAKMGKACTIVMLEEVALSTGFGAEVGGYFQEILTSHGVEVRGGAELASFEGDGRVEAVRTAAGERIECDAVIIGAGVRPDTMLAGKSGVEVGDGIICDEILQTSVEGVFAAGDVCSYQSHVHGRRLRVEHWDVALQQGRHAARGMLGEREPYTEVPYFFSDLADWASLEYVGPAHEWDEILWRGERDSGEFTAWYLHGGKLAAALSVGRSEDLVHARRLIASGQEIDAAKGLLADADSDLEAVGN